MNAWLFSWRLCKRHWRAGELRILLFALVVTVASVSAVGLFTDRVQQALARQGNLLLGADLVMASDHAMDDDRAQEARRRGLSVARVMLFPSMVTRGEVSHLAEIKAVDPGYPLRGELSIATDAASPAMKTEDVPQPGTVWAEQRMLNQLGAVPGDDIMLGERRFRIAAVLRVEQDRGGDLFSIAPRLMMHGEDVGSTGLIQFGSRVAYRLLVAGSPEAVAGFRDWATQRLQRGERMEGVDDARPEIRNVLNKTRQFLGLSALASVVLAAVAMALAAIRFAARNLDACAVMRCLGASQDYMVRVYMQQLLLVGLALGYLIQELLSRVLAGLLLDALPLPSLWPFLHGVLSGLAVLLGVTWPLLARLRNVPALRVLRSDLPVPDLSGWLAFIPGAAVISGLILWTAQDARLGWIALGGLAAFLGFSAVLAWGSVRLMRRMGRVRAGTWRFGLGNLARHPVSTIATVAGFSLGLTALLLLTLVRGDLLRNWQATLPPEAPNRFVINIQPDQLSGVRDFFDTESMTLPLIQPMVRGRLVAVNGHPLEIARLDERGRRLAEREFNLSWALDMQPDNRLTAGRWWGDGDVGRPWLSLELGIAETLGIGLHDWLTYEVAGNPVRVQVVNLRKVEWDSMRANFFAIAAPGVLEKFPASYITSFYLPPEREEVLNRLVRAFPNLTVIDVAAIMTQVRNMMERMALAVQLVFGFSLAAGVLVLYAALAATQDARAREYTLLRVLGATRGQVVAAILTEFSMVGLLSGLVAALGASVLAWALSRHVLDLPYVFNPMLLAVSLGCATGVITLAAWLGLRNTMNDPPRMLLNSL